MVRSVIITDGFGSKRFFQLTKIQKNNHIVQSNRNKYVYI